MPPKKVVKKAAAKSPIKPKVKRARRVPRAKSAIAQNSRWVAWSWLVPIALVVIFALFSSGKKISYPVKLTSAKVVSLFDAARAAPVSGRIALWSESLLKDPYLLSALGSGPDIADDAPVFPRNYDCTTFVETVGALARSSSAQELADQVIAIRYKNGAVGYQTRNHFPEADWIPNNEAAGILRDVTTQIARKAGYVVSFVNKDIDKASWFKEQGTASRMIASGSPEDQVVTVKLPYLPIERMEDSLKNIPQGSVLNVVRMNRDRYPVLISHQGFLIWKDGVAYFRHASRNKQISETPFKEYLEAMRAMPWKVIGFNINTFEG